MIHFNDVLFQHFTQPAVIEQASYVLIAVGAFMFIVSFLGYCGALRESQCLLTLVSCFSVSLTKTGLKLIIHSHHKANA